MIDRLVDQAIASLLGTISGLKVFVGAEDIEPPLQTPFCAVHSEVISAAGLKYLAWESINRSSQEYGDRRKNIREVLVRAQLT
jgi:hypothetical protein